MESLPLDSVEKVIKQLQSLRGDLVIDPPVIVRFALHGNDMDKVTLNISDKE